MSGYVLDHSKLRRLSTVCDDSAVGSSVQPVVVALCGSFNPIHNAHILIYDAVKRVLGRATTSADVGRRYVVLGGFFSPVNDAYTKAGLMPFEQRVEVMQAALRSHGEVVVDCWEGMQPNYVRTYYVLRHLEDQVRQWYASEEPQLTKKLALDGVQVRVVFACGVDLFATFFVPGCWQLDVLKRLLDSFPVVVVMRASATEASSESELRQKIQSGHLSQWIHGVKYNLSLSQYHFMFTSLRSMNTLSSTAIRSFIARMLSSGSHSVHEQARCSIAAMVPAEAVETLVKIYCRQ